MALLTAELMGAVRIKPSADPAKTAAPYCASSTRRRSVVVSPTVLRMPMFLYSARMLAEMLCPATANAAISSTAAKARNSAEKAFCSTRMKPEIASRL